MVCDRPYLIVALVCLLMRPVPAFAQPVIQVSTSVPRLVNDLNGDERAGPGDTIRHQAVVSNTGSVTAAAVTVQIAADANTTLVRSSVNVSPLALEDHYESFGNTLFVVSSVSEGVLANDRDYDGDSIAVTPAELRTAAGGDVTISAEGTFSYLPPAGFVGADTFSYTLADARGLSDVGQVSITVQQRIWYVDNSRLTEGNGRSTAPFRSLDSFVGTERVDEAGDIIYIAQGNADYNQSLTLLDNEVLIGAGAPLVVDGQVLLAQGSSPTLSSSLEPIITVANGNTIDGLELTGFTDSSAISIVDVSNTVLRRLTIDGAFGGVGNGISAVNASNVTIDQCVIRQIGDSNLATSLTSTETAALFLGLSGNLRVASSTFEDVGRDALLVDNTASTGRMSGALSISLTNSMLQRMSDFGVYLRTTSGDTATVVLRENVIRDVVNSSRRGVDLAFAGEGQNLLTLRDNEIQDTGANNLYVLAEDQSTVVVDVRGNRFDGTNREGVFLRASGSSGSAAGTRAQVSARLSGNTFGANIGMEGVFADANEDGAELQLSFFENSGEGGSAVVAVQANTSGSTVCANLLDNSGVANPAYALINYGEFGVAGFAGGDATAAAAFISSQNSGATYALGSFSGVSSCSTP